VRTTIAGLLWLAMAAAQVHAQTTVLELPPSGPVEPAQPTRILVIDVDKLRSAGLAGTPDMDATFSQFVAALSSSRGATLVLDRKAVVVASSGFDVTTLAETAMDNFRKTGTLPPLEQGPLAPIARLEVLDRNALLRNSAAGNNIAAQVHTLTDSADSEFRPQSLALKTEGEALQSQMSILPADEGTQDKADFDQRRDAFQRKVQERQDQIRAAVALAQKQVEAIAGPILQQLMADSDANILVDRMSIVIGAPHLDITPLAIAKLDAALPHVDLVLLPPPEK
jgi:Skp family chaperone for outer membrane proteins